MRHGKNKHKQVHSVTKCTAAFLVLLIPLSVCRGEAPPKKFDTASSAVQYLIKAAEVKSDAAFKQQMIEEGQRDDHVAPKSLRKLLSGEEFVRLIFSQGVVHEEGAIALYWRGEGGFLGQPADIQERLVDRLQLMGFDPFESPNERYDYGYRHTAKGVEETVLINKPIKYTGGRRKAAGTRFLCTVRSTSRSPLPTYSEIKKVMPVLYDKRINDSVYRLFGDAKLSHVKVGGTWTKYYSLRVDVRRFGDKKATTDSLQKELVNRLTKAGFKERDRPRHSTWDVYRRGNSPRSMPVVQVKTEKGPPRVCLSIQPE